MVVYAFYESDNRVMRYAETLAARGDEVQVISLRHLGQCRTEVIQGVKVSRVQYRTRNEKHKWTYLFRILSFLIRATVVLSWRHLRKPFDLVHVHSVPDFLVFSALLPKIMGTPVILDVHDILPEFYASKFGKSEDSLVFRALLKVEKISASFADHVIIANHLWQDRITTRSVAPGKCTTILNGPDLSVFRQRPKRPDDGRFVVIYPGSLNWHQGLDIAIRAVARACKSVPSLELHIQGDGPARQDLIELTEKLSIGNRVHFYPLAPIREIVEHIAEADLGVVPKRANSFGNQAFSTKVLEFMCMGVPVLLSATMIDRYYFNDSVVTFLESGNEEELAQQLIRLAQDRQLRKEQTRNASEFVREMTWEVYKNNTWRWSQPLRETRSGRPGPIVLDPAHSERRKRFPKEGDSAMTSEQSTEPMSANQYPGTPATAHVSRNGAALLCLITLLAAAVRAVLLGRKSLWLDEIWSLSTARLSWTDFLWSLRNQDPNMSFYHVLLHFWLSIGRSEASLRAMSVLFGVATVPLVYLLGKQLFSEFTGLCAASSWLSMHSMCNGRRNCAVIA